MGLKADVMLLVACVCVVDMPCARCLEGAPENCVDKVLFLNLWHPCGLETLMNHDSDQAPQLGNLLRTVISTLASTELKPVMWSGWQ
jgi:hypothetical protein